MARIPLFLLPAGVSGSAGKRLQSIGRVLSRGFAVRDMDLEEAGIEMNAGLYAAAGIVNSLIYFVLFYLLFFLIYYAVQMKQLLDSLLNSLLPGFGVGFIMLILMMKYPSILSRKKAERVDKNFVFALKDLLLQLNSGVSLYNAFVNVSNADYGEVSAEFRKIVRHVKTGLSFEKSLETLAIETRSEFLKRTMWQMLNAIKAGGSMKGTLHALISELTSSQRTKIRNYAQELNVWTLAYMMFAVAIPTIGITFLIILSSFAGMGVTELSMLGFVATVFFIQFAIIGLIKSRRPVLEM